MIGGPAVSAQGSHICNLPYDLLTCSSGIVQLSLCLLQVASLPQAETLHRVVTHSASPSHPSLQHCKSPSTKAAPISAMEPVSLGVSVIALVGLFDNALDCLKHVKVAKSFGTDYQIYTLRLQNLRLRLSRWGEGVGLGKPSTAVSQPRTSALSASGVKQAEVLVGHIIRLFSDTEELAGKYAGKQSDPVAINDDDSDGLGDAGKLCQKMRKPASGVNESRALRQKQSGRSLPRTSSSSLLETYNHSLMISSTCSLPRQGSASRTTYVSKKQGNCAVRRLCPHYTRSYSRKSSLGSGDC